MTPRHALPRCVWTPSSPRVTPIFDVLLARHRGQRAPIRQRSGRRHEVILEIRARSRCYVVVIERRGLLHGIGDV